MSTVPSSFMAALQGIEAKGNKKSLPPVHLWNPPLCDNVIMRIDENGRWYYQNSPIGRIQMVKLFSTVIRRDGDAEYYLVTPVEKIRLEVADAPFHIIDYSYELVDNQYQLNCLTNTEEMLEVGPMHTLEWRARPCNPEEYAPYVTVRTNLQAVFNRACFYRLIEELASLQSMHKPQLTLMSRGETYILG